MWTICLEREETNEVVNISDYGFEWYQGNKMVRSGLIDSEHKEEDIEALIEEGFSIVE